MPVAAPVVFADAGSEDVFMLSFDRSGERYYRSRSSFIGDVQDLFLGGIISVKG